MWVFMAKTKVGEEYQDLQLLEALDESPEAKQADLAVKIGVSVGTINWHIKRLASKGYIKVKQIGRWHWQYLLTPKGMTEKAKLTAAYVKSSMGLYRKTREQALDFFAQIRAAGYEHVRLSGQGELLEICRLTSLEQKIRVVPEDVEDVPLIRQTGLSLNLEWPDSIRNLDLGQQAEDLDKEGNIS